MSASASHATLAEDLSEIKTYLQTTDTLCEATIKDFLAKYDVLGQAALIRPASTLFQDADLLEALLDNWEGLLDPTIFVKFIYTFCLIQDISITYNLFMDSGGSTEILRAMDTNVKARELVFYGARCLAVLSVHSGLRLSLTEGDGISLIVDSLHCHKKDPTTVLVLLLLLANLTFHNADSKKAFVEANGIPIVCSIISACHHNTSVLLGCFHALRHVCTDKSVKASEAKNHTHITKEVIAALQEHTQQETLVSHGLWIILNIITGNHDNKTRFMAEHGFALLDSIASDNEHNADIMALVCQVIQQILKIQRHRAELHAKHALSLLGRVLMSFEEPATLIAALKALYTFALHPGARTAIGSELSEVIVSHLRSPSHGFRLHAILGKLVLRICKEESAKRSLKKHRAVEAIKLAEDMCKEHVGALRFLMAAKQYVESREGSGMPERMDPSELFLMTNLTSDDDKKDASDSYDNVQPRGDSSPEEDDSGDETTSPVNELDSPTLSDEELDVDAKTFSEGNKREDEEKARQRKTGALAHEFEQPVIKVDLSQAAQPKPAEDLSLDDDPEMAALLQDIDVASSPLPSPHKAPLPSPGRQQHRRNITPATTASTRDLGAALDDSLQDLDAEVEKLRFGDDLGSKILDEFDLDLSLSETAASNLSVTEADPDSILARIEAIEKLTQELNSPNSTSTPKSPRTESSKAPEDDVAAPSIDSSTISSSASLSELDDALISLELASPKKSPTKTPRDNGTDETLAIEAAAKVDVLVDELEAAASSILDSIDAPDVPVSTPIDELPTSKRDDPIPQEDAVQPEPDLDSIAPTEKNIIVPLPEVEALLLQLGHMAERMSQSLDEEASKLEAENQADSSSTAPEPIAAPVSTPVSSVSNILPVNTIPLPAATEPQPESPKHSSPKKPEAERPEEEPNENLPSPSKHVPVQPVVQEHTHVGANGATKPSAKDPKTDTTPDPPVARHEHKPRGAALPVPQIAVAAVAIIVAAVLYAVMM